MKFYKFSENWFRKDILDRVFPTVLEKEYHILEIGTFEGASTVNFLERFSKNPKSTITCVDPWTNYSQNKDSFNSYTNSNSEWNFSSQKETFLQNILVSGESNKINIRQGLSNEILPQLISENRKYDLILIDGNHTAPFVLSDAIFSWYLLKENGFLIFDYYTWRINLKPTLRPQLAVDSFLSTFADYIEIVYKGDWVVIKKI